MQMIVDKELVVSRRKKMEIVAELRKKGFRAFPKIKKAKAAGETEEALNDEDEEEDSPNNTSDYDYLLGMPIFSLTHEKARTQVSFRSMCLYGTHMH